MSKPRVHFRLGLWLAHHHDCSWWYCSPSLPRAYTEAAYHTCQIRLGPRPLTSSAVIVATETSTTVYADDPRPDYRLRSRPLEAW